MQRWHADLGLPVHHFGGGKGPVFSYTDELDVWLSGLSKALGDELDDVDELLAARRQASRDVAAQADELWELGSSDNLPTIAGLYRRAVDRDPANAHAYAGLADALTLMAAAGSMRGSAAYPRAADALARARRAQSEDLRTQCAAAWLQMVYQRRWKLAAEGFAAVLGAQPTQAHALTGRALLHVAEGELDAAGGVLRTACRENPLNSFAHALLAWSCYLARDYEQALGLLEESRAGGEASAIHAAVESLALLRMSPADGALAAIRARAQANPQSAAMLGAFGHALAAAKQHDQAKKTLDGLRTMKGESSYFAALVHAGLEETREAVARLEVSAAEGSLWSLGFRLDPALGGLHGDRRFQSLLRRLDARVP